MTLLPRIPAATAVLFMFLGFCRGTASAHPVAQGALDVEISLGNLLVRARVSTEQVLVGSALGSGAAVQTPAEMVHSHGEYFLQHLRVSADGNGLAGQILPPREPRANPLAANHVLYEIEYRIESAPQNIAIEQDVLREFEFAPGNQWEASYVVRIGHSGRAPQEGLLLTHREPLVFTCDWAAPPPTQQISIVDRRRLSLDYFWHGVHHILAGYDHLLFMAALVLAITGWWDLLKVVTAFTLAHTITLTLSVLDVFRLPSGVVEPMIAASIVAIALQNIFSPAQSRGWARLAAAFFFGLFHGLGFAGGLLEAMEGMAGATVALAIIAFSVGVEIGHQVVVLPLFCGLKLARAARASEHARESLGLLTRRWGSALISLAGAYYLVLALR